MDKRATIKVSKETKHRFDKVHKRLRQKSHDWTLELILIYIENRINKNEEDQIKLMEL